MNANHRYSQIIQNVRFERIDNGTKPLFIVLKTTFLCVRANWHLRAYHRMLKLVHQCNHWRMYAVQSKGTHQNARMRAQGQKCHQESAKLWFEQHAMWWGICSMGNPHFLQLWHARKNPRNFVKTVGSYSSCIASDRTCSLSCRMLTSRWKETGKFVPSHGPKLIFFKFVSPPMSCMMSLLSVRHGIPFSCNDCSWVALASPGGS